MVENKPTAEQVVLDVMRYQGYRRNYQVAEYFDVTPQTLSGWIKSGVIPPRHLYKYQTEIANKQKQIQAVNRPNELNLIDKQERKGEFRFSIANTLLLFAKHLHSMVFIPIIITGCAAIYLFFIAEPVYTSITKVLPVSEDGGDASSFSGMAAQFGINIPIGISGKLPWDEIYPEIVYSERLLRHILDNVFTTKKYGKNVTLFDIIKFENNLGRFKQQERTKLAIDELAEVINISKDRLSPIVTLEVEGFEPHFAAALATTIFEESGRIQRQLKTNRVSKKRKFIEERMTEVFIELEESEMVLRQFRENNRNIKSPTLQSKIMEMGREVDLQSNIYLTLKTQYEKAKIEEVEKADMVQLIDGPTVPVKMTWPRRSISLILSIFFSISFSIFYVYLREYFLASGSREIITSQRAKNEFKKNIVRLIPGRR